MPELHLALNSGIPLVDPAGGFYFVFQTGEPVFQKYDAAGQLVFERRIQGREIDALVAGLPSTWPRRQTSEGELPLVTPTIRTAAVDPDGRLWVAFTVPYTYVFDRDGDKIRTVQFRGAGIVTPSSLFFAQERQGPRDARPRRIPHPLNLGRLASTMASFIAAVVQNAPVVFDAAATLSKIDDLDRRRRAAPARRSSSFPRRSSPPIRRGSTSARGSGCASPEGRDKFRRYFESAIDVPGPGDRRARRRPRRRTASTSSSA